MYSNIHPNEVAAPGRRHEVCLDADREAAASEDGKLDLSRTLTGFTAEGEAELADADGPRRARRAASPSPTWWPTTATYLGYPQGH